MAYWRRLATVPGERVDHGPWEGRVDAFLTACTLYAGQREYDVATKFDELFAAFSKAGSDSGKRGPAGRG